MYYPEVRQSEPANDEPRNLTGITQDVRDSVNGGVDEGCEAAEVAEGVEGVGGRLEAEGGAGA